MQEKIVTLKDTINCIDEMCDRLKNKEYYTNTLPECVEKVRNAAMILLSDETINQSLVLQLLNDMMYGIEKNDRVFLLDVLRFGIKTGLEEYIQQLEH